MGYTILTLLKTKNANWHINTLKKQTPTEKSLTYQKVSL